MKLVLHRNEQAAGRFVSVQDNAGLAHVDCLGRSGVTSSRNPGTMRVRRLSKSWPPFVARPVPRRFEILSVLHTDTSRDQD